MRISNKYYCPKSDTYITVCQEDVCTKQLTCSGNERCALYDKFLKNYRQSRNLEPSVTGHKKQISSH